MVKQDRRLHLDHESQHLQGGAICNHPESGPKDRALALGQKSGLLSQARRRRYEESQLIPCARGASSSAASARPYISVISFNRCLMSSVSIWWRKRHRQLPLARLG